MASDAEESRKQSRVVQRLTSASHGFAPPEAAYLLENAAEGRRGGEHSLFVIAR